MSNKILGINMNTAMVKDQQTFNEFLNNVFPLLSKVLSFESTKGVVASAIAKKLSDETGYFYIAAYNNGDNIILAPGIDVNEAKESMLKVISETGLSAKLSYFAAEH